MKDDYECECYDGGCVWFTACYADVVEYDCRYRKIKTAEAKFKYWREHCVNINEALDDFAFFYVKKGEEEHGQVYCFSRDEQTDTFPKEDMREGDMERMATGEEVDGYTRLPACRVSSRLIFRFARC